MSRVQTTERYLSCDQRIATVSDKIWDRADILAWREL